VILRSKANGYQYVIARIDCLYRVTAARSLGDESGQRDNS
jgi:hypothetical protein